MKPDHMALATKIAKLRVEVEMLKAANAELLEAVLPFAQSEFARELGGNELGDDSIVFERNGQRLKIGDFRKAIQAVARSQKEE